MAQPDLFQAHARRSDPSTSHQAASSVKNIAESQKLILDVLTTFGPMPDQEIYKHLMGKLSESGCRTRRSELQKMGRVVDSGMRDKTNSGRDTIVWRVK